jgi:hypothetical protein
MTATARISRRSFLASLLAAPAVAGAFGAPSRVDIAEIDLGAGTASRPDAWATLLREVDQDASVLVEPRSVLLRPDDPALFEHPFAVVVGSGGFAMPSEGALEQLGRYLAYGGMILFDDTSSDPKGPFDRSVRALCSRLFPNQPLAALSTDHSLFRAFFLIDRPMGATARTSFLEGITIGGADGKGAFTAIVYCHDDLSGAIERRRDGRFVRACVPGGEAQRREATKLSVNLVIYNLTSDYKKDQAHVRKLIQDGRLRREWDEPQ